MSQAALKLRADEAATAEPRREQYDKIYGSLRRRADLSGTEKLLAAMILNLQRGDEWALARVGYLADQLGLGTRQTTKLLARLRAKGLLQYRSGQLSGTANQYRIVLPTWAGIQIAMESLDPEPEKAVDNPVDNLAMPAKPAGQSLTWHQWVPLVLRQLEKGGADVGDILPTGLALELYNAGHKPKKAAGLYLDMSRVKPADC